MGHLSTVKEFQGERERGEKMRGADRSILLAQTGSALLFPIYFNNSTSLSDKRTEAQKYAIHQPEKS